MGQIKALMRWRRVSFFFQQSFVNLKCNIQTNELCIDLSLLCIRFNLQ